jgi:uncharacterized protein (TIGR03382 family)
MRRIGMVLAIAVGVLGCTDVDVYRLSQPPPLPEDKITLEGTYCASDPESLTFPVKILFIMDDSGSMSESDPSFRRLAAARELVSILIPEPEIYFGVERFQDGEPFLLTTEPIFTRDQQKLDWALADAQHQPAGWTPYIGALSTAITAIKSDMNQDPIMAGRTRYIVLFLSDGEPTDEPSPPYTQIKDRVTQLKQLEEGQPAAGEVTLHTAYLESNGDDSGGSHVLLLQEMAAMTGGEFRNFENGDAIDFTDYDVTAISRDYRAYFPILVSNLSARMTLNGYLVDSDADGLPDVEELELGTDPTRVDTDSDGCGDLIEVKYAGWDPLTPGWETDPVHCDCKDEERTADSDGDGLTDCEEKWFSLDRDMPDSDIDFEGNPSPDHMLDLLEVMWHLGRTKWDANEDYDVDGVSNLAELATHMDPNVNDNQFREKLAYRYDYVNQQAGNPHCYDFRVSNVRVVKTLAAEGRAAGENLILLYFIEAPQDNPYLESIVRVHTVSVRFDGEAPSPLLNSVKPDDFEILGPGETPDSGGGCNGQPPVADAGGDRTVEDGDGDGAEPVTLDGSASHSNCGKIIGYLWKEDGETVATHKVEDVTLPLGEHAIELTIVDEQGNTATDTAVITVTTSSGELSGPDGGNYPAQGCSAGGQGTSLLLVWLVLVLGLYRRVSRSLRRGRRSLFGLLLIGCLSQGCGQPPDMELKHQGRPIINGQLDTDPAHDAVVALTFGGAMCSGTLISPEVVLTAAHCAQGYGPSYFTIYFGDNLNSASTRRVSEVWVHPAYNPSSITNDIAMLRLSSPPPSGITPIPYLPHSLGVDQADVGNPMEYVGFGETENHNVGVKLTVMNNLDWICTQPGGCMVGSGYQASQNTICGDQTPGGPCHGDSGGPAFVTRGGHEYVAGITSYGDQYCQQFGCSTKVDEFEAEIADFVGGVLGSPCVDSALCLSGFCVDGVCCDSACPGICDVCNAPGAMGTCSPAPDGTPCPDDDQCNGAEVCLLHECVAGEPPTCDDENPCTQDTCDPQSGCAHPPVVDGTPCPDDDLCNGAEVCQAGACVAGDKPACDDSNPCTQDSCDPDQGCLHQNLPDGTACGGDVCGPATCTTGQCLPADPLECDDQDPCTRDWCNPGEGCVHAPAEDGTECGPCMICENSRCVDDMDCVLQGGCSSTSATGSPEAGLLVLLLFLVTRRRSARWRPAPR